MVPLTGRAYLLALLLSSLMSLSAFSQVVPLSNFSSTGRSVLRSTIAEFDGSLYFGVAVDDSHQRELWRFDGQSTQLVADGFEGETELAVDEFTEFQGQLYFSASLGDRGHELYRFDGESVSLAADLESGDASSYPVGLTVHDGELYFSAKQGSSYNNLWKFDGTQAEQVASFADPRASVVLGASFKGDLYFGADDGLRGMELWKYDGFSTEPVAEINPGPSDAFPRDFVVIDNTLYFKATTAEHGQEIWQYDGAWISLHEDVNPGPKSSDPRYISEHDGRLIYSAVAYGSRSVYEFDGYESHSLVSGGGPLNVDGELYSIHGRRVAGVEINDLRTFSGELFRSTVHSAGPFQTMDGKLYFSCACDERELYTLAQAGDANLDGRVDFVDFLTLTENYGVRDGGWETGDFDRDGNVTFDDFLLQSENFGDGRAITSVASSVPEPSAQTHWLVLGCLFMLFRAGRVRTRRC